MATEIELKLLVAEENIEKLRQLLDKQAKFIKSSSLLNTYYDTPVADFRANKCALRIRQVGESYEQTLKTQGIEQQGMFIRGEWNWPLTQNQLNIELLAEPEIQQQLPELLQIEQLQAIFNTDFLRDTWLWQINDTLIEVALDIGWVKAGQNQAKLVELELELLTGDQQALLQVSQSIRQHVELTPSSISKAERGYQLAALTTNN